MGPIVRFPHFGIEFSSWSKGFEIFGVEIRYYGVIICLAIIAGYLMAEYESRRTKQPKDLYLDFLLLVVVTSIIGARLYFVAFSWADYKDDLLSIFHVRGGGLAIYGAIIAAVITLIVFVKVRKQNFFIMADTACLGLVLGQIIGRWANFMNLEAFGSYTNNIFAMQIRTDWTYIPASLSDKIVEYNNVRYLQVHPTFLYESLWNIGVLVFLLLMRKRKKFDGQIFFMYLAGYAIGRMWIEGLRTDQLLIGNTNIAISQVLSAVLAIASIAYIVFRLVKDKKKAVEND